MKKTLPVYPTEEKKVEVVEEVTEVKEEKAEEIENLFSPEKEKEKEVFKTNAQVKCGDVVSLYKNEDYKGNPIRKYSKTFIIEDIDEKYAIVGLSNQHSIAKIKVNNIKNPA